MRSDACSKSSFQNLSNFPDHNVRSERLLKERSAFGKNSVADDRIIGVSGHEEYLHPGAQADELSGQLRAAHAGITAGQAARKNKEKNKNQPNGLALLTWVILLT